MRAHSLTAYPDLAGRTFGRLTVAGPAPTPPGGRGQHWLCRCECGAACVRPTGALTRARRPTRSCGCLARERHGPRELAGQKQPPPGRLTALGPAGSAGGRTLWLCRCECGGTCTVTAGQFRALNRRSCGRCGRRRRQEGRTAHAAL